MKRYLLVITALSLLAGACGDETDAANAPTTTQEEGSTEPDNTEPARSSGLSDDLAITDVVFDDHVTVTNLGPDAVSVDGLWLCNRPDYLALPTAVIAPGASIDISADSIDLRADGGEVAIYTSSSFGDSSAMVDYVSWGSGGGRGNEAAEADLWPAGDAVAASGGGISAPSGGSSASDWSSP